MPDPSEILQRVYAAGFELQTFDRYPKALGIVRGDCIALVEATPDGLRMIGTPGWKMGEVLGVLTTQEGRKVFQAKSEVVDATQERLAELQRFREELTALIGPKPS
jgi:hypothetical protein